MRSFSSVFKFTNKTGRVGGTRLGDKAAAAAKAAIMKGNNWKQEVCSGKMFVDQDPLHREVRILQPIYS